MKRALVLCFLSFSIMGCALLQKPESPKVQLQGVDVTKAGLTGATLVFQFLIENPNDFALSVDQIEYALALDEKPFTSGLYDQKLKVPGRSRLEVPLPIQVEYKNVLASLGNFLKRKQTTYRLEGTARIGVFKIPFNKNGDVKMSDL